MGTELGNVYYSINNGVTWVSINGQPDGSSVQNVFIGGSTIYVSTQNEFAYSSLALTGGGSWNTIAQTVYSLFVTSASTLYAGTQGGYVYSITAGEELGFVAYTPINSVYVLEG